MKEGIRDGRTVVELLRDNYLPLVLREHPSAVNPYLVMRDNVIRRMYQQRTGYWMPDGEGIEVFSPADWAATLDLVGGGKQRSFVRAASVLMRQGDLPRACAWSIWDCGVTRAAARWRTCARERCTGCANATSS